MTPVSDVPHFDGETAWDSIDWPQCRQAVRKLQARIVKAVKEKRWRVVRRLQRLLTRSMSAKFIAVKTVTENRGKNTPGVDGVTWKTPTDKFNAALSLNLKGYKPLPLRRAYIPKSNKKRRPLGIPTMGDRAEQCLQKLALEPIAETLADPNSYGFRPKRSTADAIEKG